MPAHHFVIDGSNLATEGRTLPSFEQLRGAIDAFRAEHEDANVTVVVDASFEHRIDDTERAAFVAAEAAGELVSPPAGAVGRGDGFLLQIANRTGGAVVSNDSFQEFHGDYDWLFEPGRLIGGKPVPGVGWIFSLRSPVRGARSHKALREAEKDKKADRDAKSVVRAAIVAATKDALEPGEEAETDSAPKRRRKGPPPGAVNDPHPFLLFVVNHRLGATVEGEVEEFASHGAFVRAEGLRCYVPLTAMGDPPPNSAREILRKGETRAFVVQAFDPPRRGVELAMPGFELVSGVPTPETLAAEMEPAAASRRTRGRRRGRSAAAVAATEVVAGAQATAPPPSPTRSRRGTRKKAPAGSVEAAPRETSSDRPVDPSGKLAMPTKTPPKKTAPRSAAPAKAATAKTSALTAATKTASTKTAAKKTAAARTAPKKAVPTKSAPAKTAPAKTAPAKTAAKKAAPAKTAAKKTGAKQSVPTKAVAKKTAPAKTAGRKTAANKTAAKATTSKSTSAKQAAANPTAGGRAATRTPTRQRAATEQAPVKASARVQKPAPGSRPARRG